MALKLAEGASQFYYLRRNRQTARPPAFVTLQALLVAVLAKLQFIEMRHALAAAA